MYSHRNHKLYLVTLKFFKDIEKQKLRIQSLPPISKALAETFIQTKEFYAALTINEDRMNIFRQYYLQRKPHRKKWFKK